MFGLPPAIVAASLGQIGVEEVAGLATIVSTMNIDNRGIESLNRPLDTR